MKGSQLFWILLPLTAVLLLGRTRELEHQLRVSHVLAAVEVVSQQLTAGGKPLPGEIGTHHVRLLREAAALEPSLVEVPVALGTQYLQLGRYPGAVRVLTQALELEPRFEIYANLGLAHRARGEHEAARAAFDTAVRLDPRLRERFGPYLTAPGGSAL